MEANGLYHSSTGYGGSSINGVLSKKKWIPRAYPELFAIVGGKVPDFRGLFLRGVGGNAAALGVQQGDAIRNIYGEWNSGVFNWSSSGAITGYKNWTSESNWESQGWRGIFDASLAVPTAEENRPVNKSIRYLLRAKP